MILKNSNDRRSLTMNHLLRLEMMRKILIDKGIDCLYVNDLNNVRYLTGFRGSAGFVLITKQKAVFVTDFRYQEQSKAEVQGCEIVIEKTTKRVDFLKDFVTANQLANLYFERTVTYELYDTVLKQLPVAVYPLQEDIVLECRMLKDRHEMQYIKKATQIAETAFKNVLPRIKEGITELSVVKMLEDEMFELGSKKPSFDIIVASGPNSALPHAQATTRRLSQGDLVVIDWGAVYEGYRSDLTRTVVIGKVQSWQREIYEIVKTAKEKAIKAVKSGLLSTEIDAAARDYIKSKGYGEHFGHSTGHGIGLEAHELPRISWAFPKQITKGMVFTIEPGIYISGKGGVRIEDMLTPLDDTAELLSSLSCNLEDNTVRKVKKKESKVKRGI